MQTIIAHFTAGRRCETVTWLPLHIRDLLQTTAQATTAGRAAALNWNSAVFIENEFTCCFLIICSPSILIMFRRALYFRRGEDSSAQIYVRRALTCQCRFATNPAVGDWMIDADIKFETVVSERCCRNRVTRFVKLLFSGYPPVSDRPANLHQLSTKTSWTTNPRRWYQQDATWLFPLERYFLTWRACFVLAFLLSVGLVVILALLLQFVLFLWKFICCFLASNDFGGLICCCS